MEERDQDFVDAEVDGYFEFAPKHLGSFQFGYVAFSTNQRSHINGEKQTNTVY